VDLYLKQKHDREKHLRGLIEPEYYDTFNSDMELLGKMLNYYIKSIGKIPD